MVTGSGSHDLLAGRSGHPEARASTLRFIASVDVGRSFRVIQVGFWLSNQLMVSSWSLDLAAPGSSMTDRAALRRMKFPSTPASSAGSLLLLAGRIPARDAAVLIPVCTDLGCDSVS